MTEPRAEESTASGELADDALTHAILQGLRKAGTWGLSKPLINILFGRNLQLRWSTSPWPGCKLPAKPSAGRYPRDARRRQHLIYEQRGNLLVTGMKEGEFARCSYFRSCVLYL
jgi:hypothetical protein